MLYMKPSPFPEGEEKNKGQRFKSWEKKLKSFNVTVIVKRKYNHIKKKKIMKIYTKSVWIFPRR